jgi:hypothetical protein
VPSIRQGNVRFFWEKAHVLTAAINRKCECLSAVRGNYYEKRYETNLDLL